MYKLGNMYQFFVLALCSLLLSCVRAPAHGGMGVPVPEARPDAPLVQGRREVMAGAPYSLGAAHGGRDAREAPAPAPLDMKRAVELALRRNPALAASESQARSSVEGARSAAASMAPKLGTSYSASKAERKASPASARPPELGTYSWAVEVSQPLFQGFRLLSNYQKQSLQADSDRAALKQAELDMTREVQTCFLDYLRFAEDARSEGEALGRLRDQLRIARAYYEVGLRPRLDVLQAEVDVSQAETTLVEVENARDTARARLNTLLGLSPQIPMDYVGSLATRPFGMGLEQCLERAGRQRPDLFMAEKAVQIAEKERMGARSDYYPQIEAYYNVNQTGNTWDLRREGERGSRGTTWEVGARATWNVFQWGATHFADRQAGWKVSRMKHEQANLRLNVEYDIKSRLLAVREAEKRIGLAHSSVSQAKEAYDAALARYQEQVGTNFDVLNASSNLTRAQASLTSARAGYLTALAGIYAAMGEFHPDLL